MSTSTHPANGELVQISPVEEAIRQRVAEERARLEKQAGLAHKQVHHFHKPIERGFTADQRPHTTLLFGGLTWKHEKLVHGALEGLGYNVEVVPTPNVKAFQLARNTATTASATRLTSRWATWCSSCRAWKSGA